MFVGVLCHTARGADAWFTPTPQKRQAYYSLTLLTNGGCRQNKTAKLPCLTQLEKKPTTPYEQLPTSRNDKLKNLDRK